MKDDTSSLSWVASIVPLLFRLATFVVGLVAVAGGILYVKQDNLLYFPEIGGIPRRPEENPRGYRSPDERQVPFESHMIPCADGVHIHSWLIRAPIRNWTEAPTIVFFHGNAGNIGLRLPNALQMIQRLTANVLLVEYRGYGNSDSVAPSERGLKLDSEAALRFAQQHAGIDSSKLFLFGRSLGGSVAFHLADYAVRHGVPLAGVMVENTFTSISSMVDQLLPFLAPIKPLVLSIGWNSAAVVPDLGRSGVPLLFLAGAKDELVPHSHMRDLYDSAVAASPSGKSGLVQMHVIPDGTHNESWIQGGPAYWDAMRSFMGAALQQREERPSATRIAAATTATAASSGSSTTTSTNTADHKNSAIPTMSSRFIDIAREAVGVGGNGQKKEL